MHRNASAQQVGMGHFPQRERVDPHDCSRKSQADKLIGHPAQTATHSNSMAATPSNPARKQQQAQSVCGPDDEYFPHLGTPFFRNTKTQPPRKSIDCVTDYSQLRGHSFVVRDEAVGNAHGSFKIADPFLKGLATPLTEFV